ncbi:MAG: hypothetical protein QM831_05180 [Kofleriaceae bacterium]
MGTSSFAELRRLADWFSTFPTRPSLHVERLVERLGAVCVPLLGRELCSASEARRDAARAALNQLASSNRAVRPRVLAELRAITEGAAPDHGKVCALGLLGELGERGAARFHDPDAIQRTSAEKLAAQLETPADVASAADLMVAKLAPDDMVALLAIMAQATPDRAHVLATELDARLDIAPELRERIAEVALNPAASPAQALPKIARPTSVTVLVDGAARVVVVATKKVTGERRYRRWAVLIAGDGKIEDCLHEDAGTDGDAATLIANLCGDGYRIASTEPARAKELITSAARTTGADLPSAFYLGRDLLDLAGAHLPADAPAIPCAGRAIELIAERDFVRAKKLLSRCEVSADVEAALATCYLEEGDAIEAMVHLVHAIELEPGWPLHHWNLAAAAHKVNDLVVEHHALTRFVMTSALKTALSGDPRSSGAHRTREQDHPGARAQCAARGCAPLQEEALEKERCVEVVTSRAPRVRARACSRA